MILFFIIPFIALVWRALTLEGQLGVDDFSIVSAVSLSLGTTAVTVVLIVVLGTPLAYFLARYQFPLKRLLTVFIEMPIVMPPIVAGLALLSAFGRRGLIGAALADLNITITFTVTAVILAQLFVSAPFYIRAAQSRFESLPREYEDAAAVDGANRWADDRVGLFVEQRLDLAARGQELLVLVELPDFVFVGRACEVLRLPERRTPGARGRTDGILRAHQRDRAQRSRSQQREHTRHEDPLVPALAHLRGPLCQQIGFAPGGT
jgi:ABC-type tungstate transport system substrate-binding protein